jgi:hypothetical protein
MKIDENKRKEVITDGVSIPACHMAHITGLIGPDSYFTQFAGYLFYQGTLFGYTDAVHFGDVYHMGYVTTILLNYDEATS